MGTSLIEPAAPPEAGGVSAGFNPLHVLGRRWPFLAAGAVVGLAIGALIHARSAPLYEAGAQVLVVKKRTEMVKDGDVRMGAVEDYVATQVTLIRSEKIRLAAARQAREAGLSPTMPVDDQALAATIKGGLTISRDKDTTGAAVSSGVLNLTFRSASPGDCRLYLLALIKAHQDELYRIYDKAAKEKLEQIDRMVETVKTSREAAGNGKLTTLNRLREETQEEVPSIRTRVSAEREQVRALQSDLVNLRDQLALIAKTGKDAHERHLTLAQLTAQYQPTSAAAQALEGGAAAEVRVLEARRSDLARSGLGKDHPRLLAIDTQLAAVRLELERPVVKAGGPPSLDPLDAYNRWLDQKQKTADRLLTQVREQLETDEGVLKKASGLQDQVEAFAAQGQQYDAELKRLDAEKMTAQATQGAGGYTVETITPPGDGAKIAPVVTRSLFSGLAIGLALGVALMLLSELSDRSFRSPDEIRQRLGIPVIGHVPQIRTGLAAETAAHAELDPSLAAVHRPKSKEAEAFRGLRTQLFFSTQGEPHPVVQVTSPTPGDGKSTLAANLAASVAQAGRRTVLVDCDFRKPRVHKIFALAVPECGLAGVVAGAGTLDGEIVPSGVANLDLLPCGPRPANPAELLTSPQFLRVLADLRARYDFVIVDTPPVLAVTDPTIIGPRVDGVVLVFRMTKRSRPAAVQARDQLAAVGAKLFGVVVNASDGRRGGYGYGYSYGYAYGYGYKYDYQYSEDYGDGHAES